MKLTKRNTFWIYFWCLDRLFIISLLIRSNLYCVNKFIFNLNVFFSIKKHFIWVSLIYFKFFHYFVQSVTFNCCYNLFFKLLSGMTVLNRELNQIVSVSKFRPKMWMMSTWLVSTYYQLLNFLGLFNTANCKNNTVWSLSAREREKHIVKNDFESENMVVLIK